MKYLNDNRKPWVRRLLTYIAVLGGVYALGVYSVYDYTAEAKIKSYQKGFDRGINDSSWKERALQDQNYSRQLCTAWWFGSSGTERKLR